VPDLLRRRPDLSPSGAMNAESQRYRLFEAVAELLAVVAASRPLLLILEDLHWADKPTLLMLRHLARAQQRASICVIGTYRESELDRRHPLAEMLADLRREPVVTRLSLTGLNETQVRDLVAAMIGRDALDLAPLVWQITDGNPFFVGEMLRHVNESGAIGRVRGKAAVAVTELGLPEGIREVIGRRLSRTSERCNQALTLAAVVGREFDVSVLKALGDLGEDQLLDALDEAVAAHLVAEAPGVRGRFSFLHALIRETLYGELSSSRRLRLHQRVGEAIERLTHGRANPPLADLAYHFFQAAPAGSVDKAIDYATRAGDRAADALASEEASRFYDMALQSLEFGESNNLAARRVDLHTRRARAFGALAQWALEKREVELALEALPAEQTERRTELLLMLADSCFYLLDIPGVRRFAAEGLELAEQVKRSDLAADALGWLARCQQADGDLIGAIDTDGEAMARGGGRKGVAIYHGPLTLYLAGQTVEAVAAGARAAEMARASRDSEFAMYGLSHYALALGGIGRYDEANRIFEEARRFGRKYGVLPPLARATAMQAGMHLAVFDLEGAEALQSEAREMAQSLSFTPTLVSASIDLLFTMARRHDPGRAERLLSETTASVLSTPGWHEWLWKLRLSQARAELALARDEFDLAVSEATAAVDQSQARGRLKYEALSLVTRALARQRLNRTDAAIADARAAVEVARATVDPALQLRAIVALLNLEGSDELAAEARTLRERIRSALPDETMKRRFDTSELVSQVK
jgi:tetratricopeptide (TPR) repeat protein